jgi:hypothetical protein
LFLFLDFESYFDSKAKYSLRNLSIVEYVRDARYKSHGVGVAVEDDAPVWMDPSELACFDWSQVDLVGQNLKFDGFILREKYGFVPRRFIDTKSMAKALLGKTIPTCSLRDVADHFGFVPKGEMKTDGIRDLTPEQEKELAEYCLHDVDLTRQIFKKLYPLFPSNQLPTMDWTIRTFVAPKLILNTALLWDAAKAEKERRAKIFEEIGIDKKVFASNAKFPALLKEEGFDVPTKLSPRTGKPIAALALGDPEFLEMANSENDRLKSLCEARIAAKSTLLETRSEKLAKISETGAWPFDVEFSGAMQTHRFSGSSGAGGNPQNFTKSSALRSAVCAPEGYKFIYADFSNIEFRIAAFLAKDAGLIHGIENNVDMYCDFAGSFYGRKITKADKEERDFGKTALLGLQYGMGPTKFQKSVLLKTGQKISPEDAKKAVNLYRHAKYPRIKAFWKKLEDNLEGLYKGIQTVEGPVIFVDNGISLPSGLRIRYPNLRKVEDDWCFDVWKKKTTIETVGIYGGHVLENICQGLAGEICKEALIKFADRAVGQCHDEIHLLAREDEAEDVAQALYDAMVTPPTWFPNLKLEAEIHIGNNWGDCK